MMLFQTGAFRTTKAVVKPGEAVGPEQKADSSKAAATQKKAEAVVPTRKAAPEKQAPKKTQDDIWKEKYANMGKRYFKANIFGGSPINQAFEKEINDELAAAFTPKRIGEIAGQDNPVGEEHYKAAMASAIAGLLAKHPKWRREDLTASQVADLNSMLELSSLKADSLKADSLRSSDWYQALPRDTAKVSLDSVVPEKIAPAVAGGTGARDYIMYSLKVPGENIISAGELPGGRKTSVSSGKSGGYDWAKEAVDVPLSSGKTAVHCRFVINGAGSAPTRQLAYLFQTYDAKAKTSGAGWDDFYPATMPGITAEVKGGAASVSFKPIKSGSVYTEGTFKPEVGKPFDVVIVFDKSTGEWNAYAAAEGGELAKYASGKFDPKAESIKAAIGVSRTTTDGSHKNEKISCSVE